MSFDLKDRIEEIEQELEGMERRDEKLFGKLRAYEDLIGKGEKDKKLTPFFGPPESFIATLKEREGQYRDRKEKFNGAMEERYEGRIEAIEEFIGRIRTKISQYNVQNC